MGTGDCAWAFIHVRLTFSWTPALTSTSHNLMAHEGLTESSSFPEHVFCPTQVFLSLGSKGRCSMLLSLVAYLWAGQFLIELSVYHHLPQCFGIQDFNKYSSSKKTMYYAVWVCVRYYLTLWKCFPFWPQESLMNVRYSGSACLPFKVPRARAALCLSSWWFSFFLSFCCTFFP